MRRVPTVLVVGLLSVVLSGCGGPAGTTDADYAAKYRAAVELLADVERVEASYRSSGGIGRSGDVFIHADTSDRETMVGILTKAMPAIVEAADGDPEVNLAIQVVSAGGASAVSPADLGYVGTGSLTSYREFVAE
ncbi:hypothetical protein ACX8Z9_05955 [Arthrobacter halodurans]|uniref:Lipoprotein n=1 Tax=Arthrobacter halodurans TaxID=516699 RepID=A0ABV4ULV6_9MICC